MSRPTYEKESDLEYEEKLKPVINKITNGHCFKLPSKYHADYIVYMIQWSNPIGLVEVKKRTVSITHTKSWCVSVQKLHDCLSYSEMMDVQFWIFMWWTDKLGYIKIDRDCFEKYPVVQLRESYRKDDYDNEPVLMIPTEAFTLYSKT